MGKGAFLSNKILDFINGVDRDPFSGPESLAQLAIVDRLAAECGFRHMVGAAEVLDIGQ